MLNQINWLVMREKYKELVDIDSDIVFDSRASKDKYYDMDKNLLEYEMCDRKLVKIKKETFDE